jgi:hypothetical protein
MTLIIPSISDETILKFIFGKLSAPETQTLRLFTNNHNPSKNTIISNLSEATQPGYTSKNLNSSDWVVVTTGGITTALYPELTFTFTGPAQIYGYYVTTNSNGINYLMWVEKFTNAPFILPTSGGSISVSLNIGVS